jgi:hypothetical protein
MLHITGGCMLLAGRFIAPPTAACILVEPLYGMAAERHIAD